MPGYSAKREEEEKKRKGFLHRLMKHAACSHLLWMDGCASLPFMQPASQQPRNNTIIHLPFHASQKSTRLFKNKNDLS